MDIFCLLIILCLLLNHLIQAKRPEVLFYKVGETSSSIEYANVGLSVDTEGLRQHVYNLCRTIDDLKEKRKHPKNSIAAQKIEHKIIRCKGLFHRVNNIHLLRSTLPSGSSKFKYKRAIFTFFVLAILAAVVGGAAYGIYRNEELKNMSGNINTLTAIEADHLEASQRMDGDHKYLARAVKHLMTNIAWDRGNTETSEIDRHVLDAAEERIKIVEDTIQSAFSNRIHVSTLRLFNQTFAAEQLIEHASKRSLIPLAKFRSDWMQQEASFIMTKTGFKIFLHIPLMPQDGGMFIFQHVKLPIDLGDGYDLNINLDYKYLAVNGDESLFRLMTDTDLNNCNQRGSFFSCPLHNILSVAPNKKHIAKQTNLEHDSAICMWALYAHLYAVARQSCRFTVATSRPAVIQLAPTKFIIYNKISHEGRITCSNLSLTTKRSFPAHQISVLDLPAGCTARTETHHFTASDAGFSVDMDMYTKSYTWHTDQKITDVPFDVKRYLQLAEMMDPAITPEKGTDWHALGRRIKQLQHEEKEAASPWAVFSTWAGTTIGSTALALMLLMIVYMLACRNKTTPNQQPVYIPQPAQQQPLILPAGPPAYNNPEMRKARNIIFNTAFDS